MEERIIRTLRLYVVKAGLWEYRSISLTTNSHLVTCIRQHQKHFVNHKQPIVLDIIDNV
jgi:hypothetical protein